MIKIILAVQSVVLFVIVVLLIMMKNQFNGTQIALLTANNEIENLIGKVKDLQPSLGSDSEVLLKKNSVHDKLDILMKLALTTPIPPVTLCGR